MTGRGLRLMYNEGNKGIYREGERWGECGGGAVHATHGLRLIM